MRAATSKRESPTMATAGAIVRGVIYFNTKPIIPEVQKTFYLFYIVLKKANIRIIKTVLWLSVKA
jgi:hypothetical protein